MPRALWSPEEAAVAQADRQAYARREPRPESWAKKSAPVVPLPSSRLDRFEPESWPELRHRIAHEPDRCWWRDPDPRLIDHLELNQEIAEEAHLRHLAMIHAAQPSQPLLAVKGRRNVAVMETLEVDILRDALAKTLGNQREAGALLGLSERVMHYRMKKYGIGTRGAGWAAK